MGLYLCYYNILFTTCLQGVLIIANFVSRQVWQMFANWAIQQEKKFFPGKNCLFVKKIQEQVALIPFLRFSLPYLTIALQRNIC